MEDKTKEFYEALEEFFDWVGKEEDIEGQEKENSQRK